MNTYWQKLEKLNAQIDECVIGMRELANETPVNNKQFNALVKKHYDLRKKKHQLQIEAGKLVKARIKEQMNATS